MRSKLSGIVLGTACAALLAGSTAAAASTPAPVSSTASANSQWMTLSQMNPAGAAVLGSAGVAAAQPYDNPPPGASGLHLGQDTIPWPVIAIWLAVIVGMIVIATHNDSDGHIGFVSPD